MRHNFFTHLRIVTFVALLSLLIMRARHAPTVSVLAFLLLVLCWFAATLLLERLPGQPPRARLLGNTLYAALDAYLLMMVTAETIAGTWNHPFQLMGAYVFLASLLGGPVVGSGSALAGWCGLINGWLLPIQELQWSTLLTGGGAALGAGLFGTVWHVGLPLLLRACQGPAAPPHTPAAPPLQHSDMLAEMESQWRKISAERDATQARLRELEAQPPPDATASMPVETPPPPDTHATPPPANENELQTRLNEVESALTKDRAEKDALAAEKQRLMAEISELSNELMAAYTNPLSTTEPPPPAAP